MSDQSKRFPHMGGGTDDGETSVAAMSNTTMQEQLRINLYGHDVSSVEHLIARLIQADKERRKAADRIDELEAIVGNTWEALDSDRHSDESMLAEHAAIVYSGLDESRGRIEELEAIVAKRPKTADGVAFRSQMPVYFKDTDDHHDEAYVWIRGLVEFWTDEFVRVLVPAESMAAYTLCLGDCYSTEQAACEAME